MGTRCLVKVFEGETELVCIYRQYDGHPGDKGMGEDLRKFFGRVKTVTNGIADDHRDLDKNVTANGAGCLAAQLVAYLKDQLGNVYLYPPGTEGVGEEYEYHVWVSDRLGPEDRPTPEVRWRVSGDDKWHGLGDKGGSDE